MSTHTVPTTAPRPHHAARVAALIAVLPPAQRLEVYSPACPPLPHPSKGRPSTQVRAYIYERDAMTCQDCRVPLVLWDDAIVDGVLTVYATLDHIIARRHGGCHHAHNLRVLCSSCNPRRGHE